MKRILFLLFLTLPCFLQAQTEENSPLPVAPYLPAQAKQAAEQKAPITVQYPYENLTLARDTQQIFIFGQVNLPQPATLDINGQEVELYKNGGFVSYVPVESGLFELVLTAKNKDTTVQAVRHIKVLEGAQEQAQQKALLEETELFPQRSVELLPGETINLFARASSGAQVTADLPSFKNGKAIELSEDPSHPGVYRGTFTISDEQKPKTTKVIYRLKEGPQGDKAKATAPAKITVRDPQYPFTYAQINTPGIKLRKLPTASGNLYPDFRAYGVVRINGQMADQSRIWLTEQTSAWLENNRLDPIEAPESTSNTLSFIRTETTDDHTRFIFTLDRQVPIKIHEYKDYLELVIYYVDDWEQNFSLDDTSPIVSNIQWAQPEPRTLALRIYLRKGATLWGHAYRFEENQLILDLIHQPVRQPTAKKPLAGARIVLDAGHSPRRTPPYDGAVGPTGYLEYEGALALAEELKPLLEKQGATVLLTRHGNNRMALQDRYDFAKDNQAHLFVSLHYNALPETANPLAKPRGFAVYYTYPHSFALAESVYNSFVKHVPLADNGLIANTVLFIPRMPDYPSILVENAYLMFPQQEEMAKTKEGRAPLVKALYEGILNFYKNN